MEIIRASVMGYCMGVERAVNAALETIKGKKDSGVKLHTLGPLIHNPLVLKQLMQSGMTVLNEDEIQDVSEGDAVVIRAHGTTAENLERLRKKNAFVVDATCPRVKQSQRRVEEWSKKGYDIIIAGDKNHGEVKSLEGFFDSSCGGKLFVVQNSKEVESIPLSQKTALISQTTFSPQKYDSIIHIIQEINPDAVIFNSICRATLERQESLENLAKEVDAVLVVGGKQSANTRQLKELALKFCPHVELIEDESEIPQEFYSFSKVGITAGASTPLFSVEAVEEKLRKFSH